MQDRELEAMGKVLAALADLDAAERTRVIRWINEKLDLLPLIDAATRQDTQVARDHSKREPSHANQEPKFDVSLASYIRANGADGNQTHRFLVTADWLRRRGNAVLTTAVVAKALVDNRQARLANPADCLNKNVSKGLCEKTKEGFSITAEGLQALNSP